MGESQALFCTKNTVTGSSQWIYLDNLDCMWGQDEKSWTPCKLNLPVLIPVIYCAVPWPHDEHWPHGWGWQRRRAAQHRSSHTRQEVPCSRWRRWWCRQCHRCGWSPAKWQDCWWCCWRNGKILFQNASSHPCFRFFGERDKKQQHRSVEMTPIRGDTIVTVKCFRHWCKLTTKQKRWGLTNVDIFSNTILTVICISNILAHLEQILSVIMVSACKTSPKPAYSAAVKL